MTTRSAKEKSSFKLGYSLLRVSNLVFRIANRILRVGTRVLEEAPEQNAITAFWAAYKTYRTEHRVRKATNNISAAPVEETRSSSNGGAEVWIDVRAHLGEQTYEYAEKNPQLVVYAFEPSLSLAAQRACQRPNFIVIPMAISDREGFSEFFLNSDDTTNSLLPLNPEVRNQWLGGEELTTVNASLVPTVRLDTFLSQMDIRTVDYLKIDAQGHDMEVVRSLGSRMKDVKKVKLEVTTSSTLQYQGSHNNLSDVINFMEGNGFILDASDGQTYGQEMNLTFRRDSSDAAKA